MVYIILYLLVDVVHYFSEVTVAEED